MGESRVSSGCNHHLQCRRRPACERPVVGQFTDTWLLLLLLLQAADQAKDSSSSQSTEDLQHAEVQRRTYGREKMQQTLRRRATTIWTMRRAKQQ